MYSRELHGAAVEVCSFCGEPNATGWWMGHQIIAVCHGCALDAVPKLMADALVDEYGHKRPIATLRQLQQVAEKNFWEAATLAVLRAVRAEAQMDTDANERQGVTD
jgi:hypothetical protein